MDKMQGRTKIGMRDSQTKSWSRRRNQDPELNLTESRSRRICASPLDRKRLSLSVDEVGLRVELEEP
jgi:hypothetical protein